MKTQLLFAVPTLCCIALAGCSAEVGQTEDTASAEQASTASGVSATLTVTSHTSSSYAFTLAVTNNNASPVYNWQVALSMPGVTVGNISFPNRDGGVNLINGQMVFNPDVSVNVGSGTTNAAIAANATVSLSVTANFTGTYTAPTIVTVDGMANGTGGVNSTQFGVDEVARAAASAALDIAIAYENNKLPNNGDSNYAYYDDMLLSSQPYTISNGQVVFDSNAPGYAFVPSQAKAALAMAQEDPSVTSYLTSGLASCFSETGGFHVWAFRAEALKNYAWAAHTINNVPAEPAPLYYNSNSGKTDNFAVSSASALGQTQITITETSTNDQAFGMIVWNDMHNFSGWAQSTSTKFTGDQAKYVSNNGYPSGNENFCSPFNGPGGYTNPYFLIKINGQTVPSRQEIGATLCSPSCTASTAVLDPAAYSTPGPQYDVKGNLLGAQSNPFTLMQTQKYGD
jgi:hypothetical protein